MLAQQIEVQEMRLPVKRPCSATSPSSPSRAISPSSSTPSPNSSTSSDDSDSEHSRPLAGRISALASRSGEQASHGHHGHQQQQQPRQRLAIMSAGGRSRSRTLRSTGERRVLAVNGAAGATKRRAASLDKRNKRGTSEVRHNDADADRDEREQEEEAERFEQARARPQIADTCRMHSSPLSVSSLLSPGCEQPSPSLAMPIAVPSAHASTLSSASMSPMMISPVLSSSLGAGISHWTRLRGSSDSQSSADDSLHHHRSGSAVNLEASRRPEQTEDLRTHESECHNTHERQQQQAFLTEDSVRQNRWGTHSHLSVEQDLAASKERLIQAGSHGPSFPPFTQRRPSTESVVPKSISTDSFESHVVPSISADDSFNEIESTKHSCLTHSPNLATPTEIDRSVKEIAPMAESKGKSPMNVQSLVSPELPPHSSKQPHEMPAGTLASYYRRLERQVLELKPCVQFLMIEKVRETLTQVVVAVATHSAVQRAVEAAARLRVELSNALSLAFDLLEKHASGLPGRIRNGIRDWILGLPSRWLAINSAAHGEDPSAADATLRQLRPVHQAMTLADECVITLRSLSGLFERHIAMAEVFLRRFDFVGITSSPASSQEAGHPQATSNQ